MLHHHVGQGHVEAVDTVDAQQTAHGTLHGHGGVPVDETLGIVSHLGSMVTGLLHKVKVQIELGFQHISLPFHRFGKKERDEKGDGPGPQMGPGIGPAVSPSEVLRVRSLVPLTGKN